jgi:hypothetical protein
VSTTAERMFRGFFMIGFLSWFALFSCSEARPRHGGGGRGFSRQAGVSS